ncbi:MAG: HD domain-containing protein [Verrucomicrobia bacterium]|nr:HD domain-containing protein [Verrucomicrobiota bacterium]
MVDTRDPLAVERETTAIFRELFPQAAPQPLADAFARARDCFAGCYADYQAIDARYHDFEHTLQGTLCLARLLRGFQRAGAQPALTPRTFELALLAVLLHDTGYLKKNGDHEGTGAKFTYTHVARSAEFAAGLLRPRGYAAADIAAVQHMIKCTGLNADLDAIPFAAEWERTLGFALATADLLGQMAAADYVDKLPILFEEFTEAARYRTADGPVPKTFASAADLMRQTPVFWEKYVVEKIQHDFRKLYDYLRDPWPGGENSYVRAIEANIARLRRELGAVAA